MSRLKAKLEQLKLSFAAFERAHDDEYHAMLMDESDIEVSEKWFVNVMNDYIEGVGSARDWIKCQEGKTETGNPMNHSELLEVLTIP